MSDSEKKSWKYTSHHSEETKKKLSNLMQGENNPMYGKKHSELSKQKNRETHLKLYKENPEYRQRVSIKTKEAMQNLIIKQKMIDGWNKLKQTNWISSNRGIKLNDDIKQKISNTLKRNGSTKGKNNPNFGKGCHYSRNRPIYNGIKFRSFWEVIVAKWLDKQGYTWQYEPKRFYFEDEDFTYLPDFYVKELDSYIEVKGWWSKDALLKDKLFREQFPQKKLIIIDGEIINNYK